MVVIVLAVTIMLPVAVVIRIVGFLDLRPVVLMPLAGEVRRIFDRLAEELCFASVAAVIDLPSVREFRNGGWIDGLAYHRASSLIGVAIRQRGGVFLGINAVLRNTCWQQKYTFSP